MTLHGASIWPYRDDFKREAMKKEKWVKEFLGQLLQLGWWRFQRFHRLLAT